MTFQVSQASNLVFKFLSLQFMIVLLEHEDKSSNIELFKKGIGQKLEELKDDVDIVLDALMFDNTFRDCLIGEHNENEFYQKVNMT